MPNKVLILSLLLFVRPALSQNLIPNPDFENEIADPEKNGRKVKYFTCTDWESPNPGTPDFFTTKRSWNAQNNVVKPKPFSGKCYVGLVFFPDSSNPDGGVCEYLQCKLKEKLKSNTHYCFTLHLRPDELRGYSLNEINYALTAEKIRDKKDFMRLDSYETMGAKKQVFEPKAWNKISGCYLAQGGEEYLTIGIFNQRCRRISLSSPAKPFRGFYFFFDNISLVEVKDTASCGCNKLTVIKDAPSSFSAALNKPLVLHNINFETNKATLLPGSDIELDKLATYLKDNPHLKIKITGHTDNTGSEPDNLKLSKARAETVAAFLIAKGINRLRVSAEGLGSSTPLTPNDSEENRRLNRRVEFLLTR